MYENATRMTTNRRKSSRTAMRGIPPGVYRSSGVGAALPVGRSRAKEKVIGEGGVFPDVQRPDGGGFFLLGEPRAPDHRIPCGYCRPSSPEPRYRPCSAMYSSTSDGTRPRMHVLLRSLSQIQLEER